VVVDVGQDTFTIPAMSAADWLAVLMVDDISIDDIFPGMLTSVDRTAVEVVLHQGILTLEDVQEVSLEIISRVCGRPWWVALRLIWGARVSWDALGGEMVRYDADRLSIAGWLDALFLVMLRGLEDNKRSMFLMKLEMPPPGWGPDPEELEMSGNAFLAMAGE
jgi:hypothetical protein